MFVRCEVLLLLVKMGFHGAWFRKAQVMAGLKQFGQSIVARAIAIPTN